MGHYKVVRNRPSFGPCPKSTMECFCENKLRPKVFNYFRQKSSIKSVWQGPQYSIVLLILGIFCENLEINLTGFLERLKTVEILDNWVIGYQVLFRTRNKSVFKCALSGLRQFLATESPLKTMKNAFYFILKALFVLKI